MDSIGGMEKCPKHTTKRNFVMVLLEKANVHNGILMETIGISVMVSIVFCSRENISVLLETHTCL